MSDNFYTPEPGTKINMRFFDQNGNMEEKEVGVVKEFDVITEYRTKALDLDTKALVEEAVDYYLDLLNNYLKKYGDTLPYPNIKFVSHYMPKWLGRCSFRLCPKDIEDEVRSTTLIELQKSILSDKETLNRVVAHEMSHHAQFLSQDYFEMVDNYNKYGKMRPFKCFQIDSSRGHGESFWEFAKVINNEVSNSDFITQKSDMSYKTERERKPYYLLIFPRRDYEFGWTYVLRWTEKQEDNMRAFAKNRGGRFIITDDLSLTNHLPPFISGASKIRVGITKTKEEFYKLQELYRMAVPPPQNDYTFSWTIPKTF